MRKAVLPVLATLLLISSCATTITTRQIVQTLPNAKDVEPRDIFDASMAVLSELGFGFRVANERLGLIETEWRDATSGLDNTVTVLSAVSSALAGGAMTVQNRVLSFQVRVLANGYIITPKVQISSSTGYTSRTSQVSYPGPDTNEGKLAEEIVRRVNEYLGMTGAKLTWHEEQITVNAYGERMETPDSSSP